MYKLFVWQAEARAAMLYNIDIKAPKKVFLQCRIFCPGLRCLQIA